jgi:hypothetical protein
LATEAIAEKRRTKMKEIVRRLTDNAVYAILLLMLICVLMEAPAQNAPRRANSPEFTLRFEPGPHYSFRASQKVLGFLPIRYTVQPQVAVWLETPDGQYVMTLYITNRVEKQNWVLAPEEGRPEALPVWTHLQHTAVDGVSSATPKGATDYSVSLAEPLSPGRYIVMLETNRSYDYNDAFPESRGIVGQPSLIYSAEIQIGNVPSSSEFQVIGTGSPTGADGIIRPGIEGITTALELFSMLSVSYSP